MNYLTKYILALAVSDNWMCTYRWEDVVLGIIRSIKGESFSFFWPKSMEGTHFLDHLITYEVDMQPCKPITTILKDRNILIF